MNYPSNKATRGASQLAPRVDRKADRGFLLHNFLQRVLEQNKWIIDLPDAFHIRAELALLLPHLSGRLNKLMLADPAVVEWTLQGVQEILVWMKSQKAVGIRAEPVLPRVPLASNVFLTAKAPDIEFTMCDNGQLTIAEVKNGHAAFFVQHHKLRQYGVAALLRQHSLGKPIRSVQLRWLGVTYPGEHGIPLDSQKVLRIHKQLLTLKAADRWLRKHYNVTFKQVLTNMIPGRL